MVAVASEEEPDTTYPLTVLQVDDATNAIIAYELPAALAALNGFGPVYTKFNTKLSAVKIDMTLWSGTTGIRFKLAQIPKDMLEQAKDVGPDLTEAKKLAQKLQGDPGNQTLKNQLKRKLDGVGSAFTSNVGAVERLRTSFVPFQEARVKDTAILKDISAEAKKLAGVNGDQIKAMNDKVASLRREIVGQGLTIAAGAVVTGIGVVLGIVAVVGAFFTGGATLVLLIPAVVAAAGGATIIGLAATNIKRLESEIAAIGKQMGDLTLATTLLEQIAAEMESQATKLSALGNVLTGVEGVWKDMADLTTEASAAINRAGSSDDWKVVENNIDGATATWGKITDIVEKKLKTALTAVAPKSVKIGSTDEENRPIVKQAKPINGGS